MSQPVGSLSALRAQKGTRTIWCGPTLVARALGISYTEAEQKFREVNPARYGRRRNIVWTFWHETVKILTAAKKLVENLDEMGWVNGARGKYTTFRRWVDTAKFGWYAVRVTRHVMIVHVDWRGAHIYDNSVEASFYPGMKHYSKKRLTNVRELAMA